MVSYNEKQHLSSQEGMYSPTGKLGCKFISVGFWFFLFGILIGFGVLIHFLAGSSYPTGAAFLNHISLWFGSPLMYSSLFIQIGGLGMCVLGFIYLKAGKFFANYPIAAADLSGFWLAVIGLALLFLTGYIGYFIIDMIWPGFYYAPIAAGKNLWLILQGLSSLIYFIGLLTSFSKLHNEFIEYHKRGEKK